MRTQLIIFALVITSSVFAQTYSTKKKVADVYYNRFEYIAAIPMYEQLYASNPNDFDVVGKLINAYTRINDSKNAEIWLKRYNDSVSTSPDFVLKYAQVLARNGNYKMSGEWYKRYSQINPLDKRGELFSSAYNNLNMFYKDSLTYALKKQPFNTTFSDFAPTFYKEGLVYSSAREKKGAIRLWYSWTNSSYLDLYFATPDSSTATEFMPGIESLYHEGPLTFNKTQDTVYFTRSNFYKFIFRKSSDRVNKLKIFRAVWNSTDNKWDQSTPLSFNSNQFSCGHPVLSADGKTMYFISDMEGGFGGTDLYFSERVKDSTGVCCWGKPINMGSTVNTLGNEMFPSLDAQGNIYFASNGHAGLGGLDVFVSALNNKTVSEPINLGYPINSSGDDFGFIVAANNKEGYLSSDRNNAVGDDDIYKWKKVSRNLIVSVYDNKTNLPLTNASVKVSTIASDDMVFTSDEKGNIPFNAQPSKPYQFTVSKEKYIEKKLELSAQELLLADTIKIMVNKYVPVLKIVGSLYSEDDKKPIENIPVLLIDLSDSSKNSATTDKDGMFTFDLAPDKNYQVEVSFSTSGKKCGTKPAQVSTVNYTEDKPFFLMFPVFCVGDIIKVENIYYDLGKADIREDAATELNKLLTMMSDYPNMKIELRSHTDSRGSDESNLSLSDKRAKAAAEYLVSKGINEQRIIGKGYGETMPINRCKNGVKCSEEEFQVNRRTEFKILSIQ